MFRRQPVDLTALGRRYVARLGERADGRRVIVWGAGRAGQHAVAQLDAHGLEVVSVVDRDPARHGEAVCGRHVAGIDTLRGPNDDFVVIASMFANEIARSLGELGYTAPDDITVFPAGAIYEPAAAFAVEALPADVGATPPAWAPSARTRPQDVTLLASSAGSFYFRELREFLAGGLRRAGWRVATSDEQAASVAGVPIVIGPHEFFTVGHGVEWLSAESLRHAVLVTTEHADSIWTQTWARALALAGAVVDLSPAMPTALARHGASARWLPLGWYDGCDPFDRLPAGLVAPADRALTLPEGPLAPQADDRWATRPVDVLFIGASSPRRVRLLDEVRRALPDLRWMVHLPADARVGHGARGDVVETAASVGLARRAKVLLNLHRDDTRYFEWQRLVWRGLWQRTLVVTEPVDPVPGLVAGRDYLEVPTTDLVVALRQVFEHGDGAHRADAVRHAGFMAARGIRFEAAVQVLSAAVDRVAQETAA